jgi:hypothetical protein
MGIAADLDPARTQDFIAPAAGLVENQPVGRSEVPKVAHFRAATATALVR